MEMHLRRDCVSEIKRLRPRKKENAKLKKLTAEQMLTNEALKEITEWSRQL